MTHIRINKKANKYFVTIDEYPEISFTEKTYKAARDKAVELAKAEIAKDIIPMAPEEDDMPSKVKIGFGFAA